ncbi:class I SAM-dependent methyltransferase [Hydrogenovibrio halophilus]|uniref:class I SAM-dependent methyltransferase n=1 Tax=Hydrogenovibrio halophilus TaxID=373391 RepID=UPI0003736BCB|nr:class I SAM-dependent methyltransferase [Hydrogenovibrio halophilus]
MKRRAKKSPAPVDQAWLKTHCYQAWCFSQSLMDTLPEPAQQQGFQIDWLSDTDTPGCDDLTLAVTPPEPPGTPPFQINFLAGQKAHRQQFGGGKNQPLARAILGKQPEALPRVLDATAGLANDAYVIAQLGCDVTLLERLPVMAALIEDGLKRAENDENVAETTQRMHVIHADASQWMNERVNNQRTEQAFEVVYLDPMYPHTNKTAAAKKGMQLLQHLAGADTDSDALLAAALNTAIQRVVVKRPKGAPSLAGPAPHAAIKSPNTRYDIYSIRALKK